MANIDTNALLKGIDKNGNVHSVYPITKKENITDLKEATAEVAGLMPAASVEKLGGIENGANKYSHPAYTPQTSGLYKITVDEKGHVSAVAEATKDDIVGVLGFTPQEEGASGGTPLVNATSEDGIAYTATVDGLTELYVGLQIIFIPERGSAALSPTLDINGLGAVNIIMPIGGVNTSITTNAATLPTWLGAGKPVGLMYDGTRWRTSVHSNSAQYLYGNVGIAGGGTGAETAEEALVNLGAVGIADIVDNLESEATDKPLSANQGRLLKQAFQDGCDTIVAGCTSYGVTPASNSPADIVTAIGKIYDLGLNTPPGSGTKTINFSAASISVQQGTHSTVTIPPSISSSPYFTISNGKLTALYPLTINAYGTVGCTSNSSGASTSVTTGGSITLYKNNTSQASKAISGKGYGFSGSISKTLTLAAGDVIYFALYGYDHYGDAGGETYAKRTIASSGVYITFTV